MGTKFFTADTHFMHRKIYEYFPLTRPYSSVAEHDEGLIKVWNSVVGKNDEIYHHGDFAFGTPTQYEPILKRLNGRIHLIRGNHDQRIHRLGKYFESLQDLKSVRAECRGKRIHIAMCHFPLLTWDKAHYGAIHSHGHSHGALKVDSNAPRVDVGWDVWGRPIALEELIDYVERMGMTYAPVDHHRSRQDDV